MTDHQTLLSEYRRNGSDADFRELVERLVELGCSTERSGWLKMARDAILSKHED
jgi:hypothetical protein